MKQFILVLVFCCSGLFFACNEDSGGEQENQGVQCGTTVCKDVEQHCVDGAYCLYPCEQVPENLQKDFCSRYAGDGYECIQGYCDSPYRPHPARGVDGDTSDDDDDSSDDDDDTVDDDDDDTIDDDDDSVECEVNMSRDCGEVLTRPELHEPCRAGKQFCLEDHTWGPCEGAADPTNEVCDNVDNNCDGVLDDETFNFASSLEHCGGCDQPCVRENATAICADGVCGIGVCDVNYHDVNDIDDDGCEYGPCLENAEVELCGDGQDNDCNGLTEQEEDCFCLPGDVQTCGPDTEEGACQRGTQHCQDDGSWGECEGAIYPTLIEACNGLDDNCDGTVPNNEADVDEDTFRVCAGDCDDTNPDINPAAVEICDALLVNENCADGANEGCICVLGEFQSCGSDVGECVAGTQDCVDGYSWTDCVDNVDAVEEICDGLDNDCDNVPDNGYNVGEFCPARGICGDGFYECVADGTGTICSTWPGGSLDMSGPEICEDLADNDCDNATDEPECICLVGLERPCGETDEGECAFGAETCQSDGTWGACEGAVGPDEEVCDGLDNNCDGEPDEICICTPDENRDCGIDAGECSFGTQTCVAGLAWSECVGGVGPVEEICDGLDNDCDGTVPLDELNSDADNFRICQNDCNDADAAVFPGATELCDGIDNNCNGQTDEGYFVGAPCDGVGACGAGTLECAADQVSVLCSTNIGGSENQSVAEVCSDLIDNDCDGVVDEECVCTPGATRACGTDVGECVAGTQECVDGFGWSDVCAGEVSPIETELCNGLDDNCDEQIVGEFDQDNDGQRQCAGDCNDANPNVHTGADEICDSIDNNCNGDVDEGYFVGAPCDGVGACGAGTLECATVDSVRCSTNPGASDDQSITEVCGDLIDNDCDGVVDEECVCTLGETRACGSDTGECVAGIQTCVDGFGWSDTCEGEVPANETEACNGLDDNCDGQIVGEADQDNDGQRQCAGDCNDANPNVHTGADEICDSIDNNCNGDVDEGYFVGAPCDGVGACGAGTLECASVDSVRCSTNPGASDDQSVTEVCGDLIDNDCDNMVDEGCICVPDETRNCGTDVGECSFGMQTCVAGFAWSDCIGGRGPVDEVCNGLDDNCDGTVPENETDEDSDTYRVCDNDCDDLDASVHPGAQELCDGMDNDCDESFDESFPVGAPCHGFGACGIMGELECNASGTGVICSVEPGGSDDRSSEEICDEADNDCDNSIDEVCVCEVGDTRPCGTDVGECVSGTETCVDGFAWGPCQGAVGPVEEVCDLLDNNCDGMIPPQEQDLDTDGYIGCEDDCDDSDEQINPGALELCDDIDNNCDSHVDEGYSVGVECRGMGACGLVSGVFECAASQVSVICSMEPGGSEDASSTEVCGNLIDDDCNGLVDEGCVCTPGATRACGTDVGLCVAGTQECVDGFGWSDVCAGEIGPAAELCDGLDHDCDGNPTNGFDLNTDEANCGTCGNVCNLAHASEQCVAGTCRVIGCDYAYYNHDGQNSNGCEYGPCVLTRGGVEYCDSIDNDCDGTADENFNLDSNPQYCGSCNNDCTQLPYVNAVDCEAGACAVLSCLNGHYDANGDPDDGCEYACTATGVELCDGEDNDCDGRADEGCVRCSYTCPSGMGGIFWYDGITDDRCTQDSCNRTGTFTVRLEDVCQWGNHATLDAAWMSYNCHNEVDWLIWPANNNVVGTCTNLETGSGVSRQAVQGLGGKGSVVFTPFDCDDLGL